MINVRDKGFNAEREIATTMNGVVMLVMRELGFPEDKIIAAASTIQRNQNQSAVGGNDLTNTFGMGIEIKRQELLAINSWWKQCEAGAMRNGELPVLIFKQNHKPWRVITYATMLAPAGANDVQHQLVRCEIDWPTFLGWFKAWVIIKLQQGEIIRT